MSAPVVIVGGGPAGMATATQLAEYGVASTLIEEHSRLGGVVYRGPLRSGVDLGYLGARYSDALYALHSAFSAGADWVDVRLNTRIVGDDGCACLLCLDVDEHLQRLEYSQLVLCAGCHERSVPFPGWTLPGVMLLGGLQLQLKSSVVRPLGPTVIAGTGPLLPLVACQLHRAGATVVGVFEACALGTIASESLGLLNAPQLFLDGLSMLAYLKLHGIAMFYGWGVVEAHGEDLLAGVTVAPYSHDWQADRCLQRQLAVRTLAVGYGFIPRTQLGQQIGLGHHVDGDGCLCATVDDWQRSSEATIHVAGDVGGIRGGEAAVLTGRIAALSVLMQRGVLNVEKAQALRQILLGKLAPILRFRKAIDHYTRRGRGQLDLPEADTIICRCENVTRADIDNALAQGVQDLVSLKMRTRVGMGDCQGRMCVGYCSDRLRDATGLKDVGWLRPRFPIDPVPFSSFPARDKDAWS